MEVPFFATHTWYAEHLCCHNEMAAAPLGMEDMAKWPYEDVNLLGSTILALFVDMYIDIF